MLSIEEVKIIYERYDQFSDAEKGALIGYVIGKYGVDIFAGGMVAKGFSTSRNLRAANTMCNLEVMAVSNANKEAIVASALKHASEREIFLKNIKYNFDAHNKHILGHNDYKNFRSIWEHPNPESLLKKFAGKGVPHRGEPGLPGYKEVVDFGEHIGFWKDKAGTQVLPTTRGTIHYSSKEAHIVPSNPNPNVS